MYVLHQKVEEVLLYCTVLDSHGKLVTGLDSKAFRIHEGETYVALSGFSSKDVPVSLALVLDQSGSMTEKRAAIQSAAVTLIKASNPEDETSVTNFADRSYLDQDFTSDVPKLQAALSQSQSVSGGTALFDTLMSTADHLAKAGKQSKQVIVVVTDGRDNASSVDLAAAVRHVQTVNGPVIYSIGLLYDLSGGDAKRARNDLRAIAYETGGIAFFPSSLQDVGRVAAEVARDIRNQYTLIYHPPQISGATEYRGIKVEAQESTKGRLQVRTRKGYLHKEANGSQEGSRR